MHLSVVYFLKYMSFQMLAHFSLLLLTTLFDISLNRIYFLKLILC